MKTPKRTELELFDTWEDTWEWWSVSLWVPSYWNKDIWYYQTRGWYNGMEDYDDFGRHIHHGTFLPMIVDKNLILNDLPG